jgi:cytochrome c biogenesis protein CcmG, thiol:disulfide interchange protein DsbE
MDLNGRDSSGKIAIDYGVWGIPETFFFNPQGRITHKHAGELRVPVVSAKLDDRQRHRKRGR